MDFKQQILLLLFGLCIGFTKGQQCRFAWQIPADGRRFSLRSPNFPNSYSPGSSCVWYMYTDPNSKVSLNCHTVNINANFWGCRDTLTVTGSNNDASYCIPFDVVSHNNKLLLTLTSDTLSPGGSFSCTIQAIPKDECNCGWSYRTKIVGGETADPNEFPFMVSLIDARKASHACGASIISERWVVTAAHCLDVLSPETTGVLVGEHDFTTGADTNATVLYRTNRFVYHPGWTPSTTRNDIGLVEVARPISFNIKVGPVCLPFNRPNVPELGEQLTVIGWGTLSFGGPVSDTLQKTNIRVVDIEGCQKAYGNKVSPSTQICTFERGKDSCQFDSGGPLLSANPKVSRWFLAGLVSYGGACAENDPSVSTKVYPYLTWIKSITGENFCVK